MTLTLILELDLEAGNFINTLSVGEWPAITGSPCSSSAFNKASSTTPSPARPGLVSAGIRGVQDMEGKTPKPVRFWPGSWADPD